MNQARTQEAMSWLIEESSWLSRASAIENMMTVRAREALGRNHRNVSQLRNIRTDLERARRDYDAQLLIHRQNIDVRLVEGGYTEQRQQLDDQLNAQRNVIDQIWSSQP